MRAWEKYRKPHLLISDDHTQIITQLLSSQNDIVTGRGKNKYVNLSAVTNSPPTLIFGICAWNVVKASNISCTGILSTGSA